MLGRSPAEGGSTSAAGPSSESDEAHSLYKYIDISRVYGSNIGPARVADRQEAARRCIKPWHQRSDVAESTESLEGSTVILNIPFTQIVRISTLLINQGSGDEAPRRVRMYINRPHGLDLDEISDDVAPPPLAQSAPNPHMPTTGAPTSGLPQADFLLRDQETTVGSPEERIQEYPLARFAARFANVQSVHVVLSDALTSPSRTYYLSFRGVAPHSLQDKSRMLSVRAEDAASSPMGKVKQNAGGASVGAAASSGSTSAADGTGGQAR